jgi:response regulator RpfG family c-di-GMP phosphodiesterase
VSVSGSPPVLLLVDDETRILSALRRTLRREGYEILTAESAAEGLRILESCEVDLVLTDQKMPGMSGLEFLEKVAARHPEVARLVITGWPEEIPPDQIERLGIRALIPKPWDDQQLRSLLRENT